MVERRRLYRIKEDSIFVLDPTGQGRVYSLEDMSCGGVCFEGTADVAMGSNAKGELKFSNPRLRSIMTIPASIKPVWSRKTGDRFRVGAEFIDMNNEDREFISKRIDRVVETEKLRARRKEFILHALMMIAVLAGAALFIFQNRTFNSIQDSLKTALSYTERERVRLKSAFDSTLKELDDTKVLLAQAESLLTSERLRFNGEIAALKMDITNLKSEVSGLNARLHNPKELRLAMREVKKEIHLKRIKAQEKLDRIKLLAGNRGYVTKDAKLTLGSKGVTITVLPAEIKGISNWK